VGGCLLVGKQVPWERAREQDFRGELRQADGVQVAGSQRGAPPKQFAARAVLEAEPGSFNLHHRAGPAHAKSFAVKPASFAKTLTRPRSRSFRASFLAFHAAQQHLVEQYFPVGRFGVKWRS